MKRLLALFTMFIIISLFFPSASYADIGPKPSIKLIVLNPPEDEYYLDLLIDYDKKHSYTNIHEYDELDENMVRFLEEYNEDGWRPALVTGTNVPLLETYEAKEKEILWFMALAM